VRLRSFFAGVVAVVSLQTAQGQETRLKLDDLLTEALRNNPEILAAQKRYEAARQRPSQASSLPDPMLSLGYSSSGSPRPVAGLGAQPTSRAGFMVSQEFPYPGKRKLRGEIADKEAEEELQEYHAVELGVVSRLKQAYHRLDYAYKLIQVMETNRDALRTILRITEARYSVGKAAQQDIFKAQTQLSILETRILRMEQEERGREAEINSILARPPGSPLAKPVNIPPGELTVTLEELNASARENSPTLRREEKEIQKTELALNLARKEYYPDYTVSGGYFNMGRMPDMYEFRIDFKLPAYFRRKQRAGVAEQASSLGQARHSFEAADQAVHYRIRDDYLMAQTSYRLMQMYADTVMPQAGLALESSLASYETGAVDFLSVLSNLMTKVEYEENYHEEMLSFHLALVRLEETTGKKLMD
jgi:cobalt-zinc-cadmium efflux system outer membrane protein